MAELQGCKVEVTSTKLATLQLAPLQLFGELNDSSFPSALILNCGPSLTACAHFVWLSARQSLRTELHAAADLENSTAATPAPTNTAFPVIQPVSNTDQALRPGPVIVDLGHFNRISRSKFQPLAAALAQRGVGIDFWLPTDIDPMQIQSFFDFPDQSENCRFCSKMPAR